MTDAAPAVAARSPDAPGQAIPSQATRTIALLVLFIVGTINYVDRQILAVLVEPIKAELHLSDTQFGLLTGLAFSLFYAVLGVPVALLADRVHRVRLIAVACLVWSGFSAACGLAGGFLTLALARFGVGAGEAGGTPPSLSILADYYPPEKRSLIIGIFTANGPFGVFIGAALGGWAAQQFGWRGAFFCVGALGLVAAPLLLFFVREPVRGASDPPGAHPPGPAPSLLSTAGLFYRRPSLGLLLIASGLTVFVSNAILAWTPAFLMRTQGMSMGELSSWFALAAGASMGLGIWGGGAVVNLLAGKSPRAYALVPCACMLLAAPTLGLALLAQTWQASLLLLIVPMILTTAFVAPALALVQNLAPPNARATASALLLLVFNLIGAGGGPLFIGMISDAYAPAHGVESLRIALLCLLPVAIAAGLSHYAVSRFVARDLAAVSDTATARPA